MFHTVADMWMSSGFADSSGACRGSSRLQVRPFNHGTNSPWPISETNGRGKQESSPTVAEFFPNADLRGRAVAHSPLSKVQASDIQSSVVDSTVYSNHGSLLCPDADNLIVSLVLTDHRSRCQEVLASSSWPIFTTRPAQQWCCTLSARASAYDVIMDLHTGPSLPRLGTDAGLSWFCGRKAVCAGSLAAHFRLGSITCICYGTFGKCHSGRNSPCTLGCNV
jgi:hypothetical protein